MSQTVSIGVAYTPSAAGQASVFTAGVDRRIRYRSSGVHGWHQGVRRVWNRRIRGCNGGSYGYTLHVQLLERQRFLVNDRGDVNTGARANRKRKTPSLHTTQRYYRIDRRDISYLRFILEGYDGAAVLTTRDAARGIVSITIAPGCEALVDSIISSLLRAEAIFVEPLPEHCINALSSGRACADSS